MAVKRRTIWMSDEDWVKIREKAALCGLSPSAYIRAVDNRGFVVPEALLPDVRRIALEQLTKPSVRVTGPAPAVEFRPAPKPGKGK